MPRESKHDRFLRLGQRRLERAAEELRLIANLASDNYESAPEEHTELLAHLDTAMHGVAQAFGIPYHSIVGPRPREPFTEEQIKQVIDLVENYRLPQALDILRASLSD